MEEGRSHWKDKQRVRVSIQSSMTTDVFVVEFFAKGAQY